MSNTEAELNAESVVVVQVLKWRGICPRCGWRTQDELTPEAARESVERHLQVGYWHEGGAWRKVRTDAP